MNYDEQILPPSQVPITMFSKRDIQIALALFILLIAIIYNIQLYIWPYISARWISRRRSRIALNALEKSVKEKSYFRNNVVNNSSHSEISAKDTNKNSDELIASKPIRKFAFMRPTADVTDSKQREVTKDPVPNFTEKKVDNLIKQPKNVLRNRLAKRETTTEPLVDHASSTQQKDISRLSQRNNNANISSMSSTSSSNLTSTSTSFSTNISSLQSIEDNRQLRAFQDFEYEESKRRDTEQKQRVEEEQRRVDEKIRTEENLRLHKLQEEESRSLQRSNLSNSIPEEIPNDEVGINLLFQYQYDEFVTRNTNTNTNISSRNPSTTSTSTSNKLNIIRKKRRFSYLDTVQNVLEYVHSVFLLEVLQTRGLSTGIEANISVFRAYPGTELLSSDIRDGMTLKDFQFTSSERLRVEISFD